MILSRRLSVPLALIAAATIDAVDGSSSYATIPGHDCIRSMSGMMESMEALVDSYPGLIRMEKIGESYLKNGEGRTGGGFDIPEGGFDIYAFVVTDSDSAVPSGEKGKALFTSGVHSREYAPPELLARFLESLVEGHGDDAEITTLLERTEVHAILYVNPDGRWVAEKYPELYWRKNLNPNGGCGRDDSYGVDVNRNFDFMWADPSGASDEPCDDDYHGASAESEPETKALAQYMRRLFPAGQRKDDPEGDMDVPFGEEITGVYADVHSAGGYVYYPWGHRDSASPDDEALQALGRKLNSFNDYRLWAGGQPDFLYEASGDTSDYAYGALGVASLGFEIGDDFYQECGRFESEVVPKNLPALMYAAKIALRPFREVKGPDVLDLRVTTANGGGVRVSATASDGSMVNSIVGSDFGEFATGGQVIASVTAYLDVHPDDYAEGDISWDMQPARRRLESKDYTPRRTRAPKCDTITQKKECKRAGDGTQCEWFTQSEQCASRPGGSGPTIASNWEPDKPSDASKPDGSKPDGSKPDGSKPDGSEPAEATITVDVSSQEPSSGEPSAVQFTSGEEDVELTIDASELSPGARHTLYVQATDSGGYKGPVSSLFIEVPQRRRRRTTLRGTRVP